MVHAKRQRCTLICTLGEAAPVVSETLRKLREAGHQIDQLVIIHTNDPRVWSKTILDASGKPHDIGLRALLDYLKRCRPAVEVRCVNLGMNDIRTEQQNNHVLSETVTAISDEMAHGRTVLLGISGGRKTMSALALFAGYLMGVGATYHVLTIGNEHELTTKYRFAPPNHLLNLVEIPNLNVGRFLSKFMPGTRDDPPSIHEYFKKHGTVREVMDRIYVELENALERQHLKEEYEKRIPAFEQISVLVESILRKYALRLDVYKPVFQRRIKRFDSFWEKILKKRRDGKTIDDPFAQIRDLAACRAICYFKEDQDNLHRMLLKGQGGRDFRLKFEKKERPGGRRYHAYHYDVRLSSTRGRLTEYDELQGVWCELQIKTVYSHMLSELDHELTYKSEEYKRMDPKTKRYVDQIFDEMDRTMQDTEKNVSRLRDHYSQFKNKKSPRRV